MCWPQPAADHKLQETSWNWVEPLTYLPTYVKTRATDFFSKKSHLSGMKALFHFPRIPYCPSILYHAFLLFNWEKKEVIEQLPLKHWTISPRNTEKSTSLKNLLICWISIPKQLKYLSFTVKKKANVSEFLCKLWLVAIYSKSLPIWWQKVS